MTLSYRNTQFCVYVRYFPPHAERRRYSLLRGYMFTLPCAFLFWFLSCFRTCIVIGCVPHIS